MSYVPAETTKNYLYIEVTNYNLSTGDN